MIDGARPVVLVVDDDADHGFMLETVLDAEGYDVRVATSRTRARELLEAAGIDVLVTDFALGDGNALELLKDLGARRPRFAIVVSGFDSPSDVDRSRRAGFDAHLGKPIPIDLLRKTIAAGLSGAPLR